MNLHIRKNEKGIALLFTLGILSVLLVLALAFATTSITERKAAANNAELTSARLLAESGVQRAIAALRYYDSNWPTAAYDKIVSREKDDGFTSEVAYPLNRETFDYLWRLETISDGVSYFTWPSTTYRKEDDVNWVYIHDTSDANLKILGRIAYCVVASGGKLDPSMCVSHQNDSPGTTDLNGMTLNAAGGISYPRGTADDESIIVEERNGKYVSEINVKNIDNNVSGYLGAATIKNMSTTTIGGLGGGLLPDRTRWADFDSFANAFTAPALSPNQKSKYNDWFIVSPSSQDDERFWIDSDGDGLQDAGEWFNRFNLARTDWTSLPVTVAGLTGASVAYTSGVFSEGTSIPWIANFGKKASDGTDDNTVSSASNPSLVPYYGSYANVADRRKQIAANLVDYCDSDSSPTTDYVEAAGTPTCTYMGNERTPYINELVVGIHVTGTQTDPGASGNYTLNLDVKSSVGGELINMYGDTFDAAKLTVAYSITGTLAHSKVPAAFAGNECNQTYTLTSGKFSSINVGATPYKYDATEYPLYSYTSPSAYSDLSTVSFKSVVVTITSAKLEYPVGSGIWVDFAKLNKTFGPIDVLPDNATGSFEVRAYFGGIQTNDPRQNINTTDWSDGVAVIGNAGLTYGARASDNVSEPGAKGTPNATNYVAAFPHVTMATPGKDPESGNDPAYDFGGSKPKVSTAYIRDAPMESPWEIGFIHRGAAWETINLKKYNNDDDNDGTEGETNEFGVSANIGGRAYDKGDANILDQIKMTHDTNQGYGKVNIRAISVDSLRALIAYIKTGSIFPVASYKTAMPGANGTLLDYNTASLTTGKALANIANAISGSDKRPFLTRAQVANVSKLTDGTELSQVSDAQKEEIIGKFINLTKATIADEFTIIAIAQTIKDVGTVAGITINKDINGDGDISDSNLDGTAADPGYFWNGSVATAPALPGLVDEAITGCKIGQYDLGADEILSEQKVLCVVRKSSTGKWEIVRYEYVE